VVTDHGTWLVTRLQQQREAKAPMLVRALLGRIDPEPEPDPPADEQQKGERHAA
jgi:hypothetical protein